MKPNTKSNNNFVTAIIMSVRNEESFIAFNIDYHLDLGFNFIFIANHCSTDNTSKILAKYKKNHKIIVQNVTDPVFDHAKIVNNLLKLANNKYKIDWLIFLDADEFLSISDKTIQQFVNRLNSKSIPYATIGWVNALFDYTNNDYTCSPVNKIDTTKFYKPWPEKKWQEYGHFRKTIVKNHNNIEVVVGGHYVKTENNISFFGKYHWNPYFVPFKEAKILHFEFREKADILYKKWEKLAKYENDSTSSQNAPWMERLDTIKKYVKEFKNNIQEINEKWFSRHSTFWGTPIPNDQIIYDNNLVIWYGKYIGKKVINKEINKICLVRIGNLGDVIMSEPTAVRVKKYVKEVILATDVKDFALLNSTYDKIISYKDAFNNIEFDAAVKLTYEYDDNTKSYINGFLNYLGFKAIKKSIIPKINNQFLDIVSSEYVLIAPHTSTWQLEKRNWGYNKFIQLQKLLVDELNLKTIILENSYSFKEMLSLIKNCKFFIGNDSGPAIIAQSFKKKSFIIFGATSSKYLHLIKSCVTIYDTDKHALCSHTTRQEEIDCCEPFCMEKFRVKDVFEIIKKRMYE